MSVRKTGGSSNGKWGNLGFYIGGAVAVGISAAVLLLQWKSAKHVAQQRKLERRIRKYCVSRFDSHKLEILLGLAKLEWNPFSMKELEAIYDSFINYLPFKSHGALTRVDFVKLLEKSGLHDDAVEQKLFAFWDTNSDGAVSFVELVRGLAVIAHGTKREKLERLFDVFDLDRSDTIDRNEYDHLLRAFFPSLSADERKVQIDNAFAQADQSTHFKLTKTKFMALAEDPETRVVSSTSVLTRFLTMFGLDPKTFEDRRY